MDRKNRRRLKLHLEKQLDANLAERQCGECSACCVVLEIPVLDKPAGETCKHVAGLGGCSIYGERPKPCREYQCGWRAGVGSLADRPDRVGVVFSPTQPGVPGHPAFRVAEQTLESLREPGAVEAMAKSLLPMADQKLPPPKFTYVAPWPLTLTHVGLDPGIPVEPPVELQGGQSIELWWVIEAGELRYCHDGSGHCC